MKIVVTGGHPAPALAFIDYARSSKEFRDIEFVFIGRQYNNQQEKSVSYEYKEITARKIPFYHLTTGRFTRLFSFSALRNMLYVPLGFYNSWKLLSQIKPDRVMTFGGYLALPVAYVAHKMKIPVYVHEQTIAPGLATKKIAEQATKVFISFPQSKKDLPITKCIETGNLVRDAVFQKNKLPFSLPSRVPVLYVTGGSLGSHSVNAHIEHLLPTLLKDFVVIHQTGNVEEYNDFQRLKNYRDALPPSMKERYFLLQHVSAEEVGAIFDAADIIVSRSGANTVTELVALKKPAILIPLPWSARNEQQLQAEMLQKAGVAAIFQQNQPSEELLSLIQSMYQKREKKKEGFKSLTMLYKSDAARKVLETVIQG